MDAVKFIRERKRMCNDRPCADCPLFAVHQLGDLSACKEWCMDHPEASVTVVEKWAEEHPRKTRQSVFLEQWPNANVIGGYLRICPRDLTGDTSNCGKILCSNCTRNYWLQEVE